MAKENTVFLFSCLLEDSKIKGNNEVCNNKKILGDGILLINPCRLKSPLSVALLLWEWITQKHWVYHFLKSTFLSNFLHLFSLLIHICVSMLNCWFFFSGIRCH